jgi:hypothetical protein
MHRLTIVILLLLAGNTLEATIVPVDLGPPGRTFERRVPFDALTGNDI